MSTRIRDIKLEQFVKYSWGTLVRPRVTFQRLRTDPAALAYGTVAILVVGLLYTAVTAIGYSNGFGACSLPWLPIAAADYYYFMTFFTIPVFWFTTLAYASVVQFISRFAGGEGSFEQSFAVAAFGLQVTMIPLMLIPEAIYFTFSIHNPMPGLELCGTLGLGLAADWARLLVAVVWQLVAVTIGLQAVQHYSWWKAIIVGLVGFTVYQLVFWTYVR